VAAITFLLDLVIYGQERMGKAWCMMEFENLLQDLEDASYDSCGYRLCRWKMEGCGFAEAERCGPAIL
jgi:hypothetical protein